MHFFLKESKERILGKQKVLKGERGEIHLITVREKLMIVYTSTCRLL